MPDKERVAVTLNSNVVKAFILRLIISKIEDLKICFSIKFVFLYNFFIKIILRQHEAHILLNI